MTTSIEIPQFIKKVMVAKARRIKYYKKGGKIPKKYANNKFDNKGRMINSDGDHVVANPRTIGTARYLTINGQQLYNARMSPHMRSKIVNAVKESYMPYVKNVKPIKKLPVAISLDFYDTTRQANWDLDNQWLYGKCFQDLIVKLGILPDDDIKYITQASAPRFFPVDTEEERKLIFHITTETRVEILKHKFYDTFYRKGK
jgi:hypothetical protein|tara:strand:+ start:11991 stop:12593 length:603 start_codon:yes stop_codon:yes gene_type:complete